MCRRASCGGRRNRNWDAGDTSGNARHLVIQIGSDGYKVCVEEAVSGTCRYVTGITFDAKGHLQLAPGTSGSWTLSAEGFIATFDEGGRLRVPADTITVVEVRGDDEKHRDAAAWESGLLMAAISPALHRSYLAVGRRDGANLVFEVPDESASELRNRLAPLVNLFG